MFEIVPNWHPVFVHFTVGLLLIAAAWYLLAWLPEPWGRFSLLVSRANLFAGVLITVATVIAGFLAFNSVQHDDPSHEAMKVHRNWALAAATLWAVLAGWEGWRTWRRRGRSLAVTAAVVIAAVMLGITGLKGGELVFEHGLGVQSLPNTDDHAHGSEDDSHGHTEEPSRNPETAPEAVGGGTAPAQEPEPSAGTQSSPASQADHAHESDGHDHTH